MNGNSKMDSWTDSIDDGDGQDSFDDFYGGKNALIFLIDVASPEMHAKVDEDTRFQQALKCIHATLRRKILGSPNDMLAVLLFGTEKNLNIKDFNNLSLILPMGISEGSSIQLIEQFTDDLKSLQDQVGQFDSKIAIHEALWQCQSLFNEITGKLASKKIILFTTNPDPHANDPMLCKQAIKKSKDLEDTDVILEVIPMHPDFDFSRFYDKIVTIHDHEGDEKSMTTAANSLEQLMKMVRKRIHNKRSVGKCHWDLGQGVKLGVSSYNFVQRATKPGKIRLARNDNEQVKILRQFMDPNTGAPLMHSDINKFIEFAGKKLQFTQDEVRSIQKCLLGGSFGFKLLCFKPLACHQWSGFVRTSHFIYPDESEIKGNQTRS